MLETGLEVEVSEHLGYDKHAVEGRNGGNSRNGARSKTVLTDIGPVEIDVPRDRDGSFEPRTVRKRQRRLGGADAMVISLCAKVLTAGEISAHLAEVYVAVFIDAIVVNLRDGQVTNRPVYAAIGVTVDGVRDILGLWIGSGGEGAKFWLQVLTEIRNRGTTDVCIVVCDGLKGLPEAIETTWPLAVVQTCVLHLIRNTFRLASRKYWDAMARDLRPIYTAVNEQAAKERLGEFHAAWGDRYPAIERASRADLPSRTRD